jgi:hypothetical protein
MKKTFFLLFAIIGLTSCDSWLTVTFAIVNDTEEKVIIHERYSDYIPTMEDVLPTDIHDSAYLAEREKIIHDTIYTIEPHKSIKETTDLGAGGWNDEIDENMNFEGGYIVPLWETIQEIIIGNDTLPKEYFQNRKNWSFSGGNSGTWTLHIKHSSELHNQHTTLKQVE